MRKLDLWGAGAFLGVVLFAATDQVVAQCQWGCHEIALSESWMPNAAGPRWTFSKVTADAPALWTTGTVGGEQTEDPNQTCTRWDCGGVVQCNGLVLFPQVRTQVGLTNEVPDWLVYICVDNDGSGN
jgi:hypothetical protein